MLNPIYLPYEKIAKSLIQEGDILLYRGQSLVSKIVKRVTQGRYSHVALASWHNSNVECIEFREGAGGRTSNFLHQLDEYDKYIDIYRAISPRKILKFNLNTHSILEKWIDFDGRAITNEMRSMTGLPYGWRRILWLAKFYLLGCRFIYRDEKIYNDTPSENHVYPVCSTAVATCFSRHNFDLITNRSDERTTPVDIARSPLIQYLFTPVRDW